MAEPDLFPLSHWMALGYNGVDTLFMRMLNRTLINEISRLKTVRQGTTDIVVDIGLPEALGDIGLLLPHDSLLPLWKELAEAMSSSTPNDHEYICLNMTNIQLSAQLVDELEPALKIAPVKELWLFNNRLGNDGIEFVTRVLEANPYVETLSLHENNVECGIKLLSLVEAARIHYRLKYMIIGNCGIGRLLQSTPEFLPALFDLSIVFLKDNGIGTDSASLVADCLATNPQIKTLDLAGNLLNDEDVKLLANSLKSNTNLGNINLQHNKFTDAGIKTLFRAVYDDQSLDAIRGSNHTCKLALFADSQQIPNGVDESVLAMNHKAFDCETFPSSILIRCMEAVNQNIQASYRLLCIEGRKKMKMMHAIYAGDAGQTNMQLFKKVPLELWPTVMTFVQENNRFYADPEDRNDLDRLFQVIRGSFSLEQIGVALFTMSVETPK